ncbi:phosphodiester glycosidase family protein [Erythrobacter sp. NE805]|uniref:phosphodiester glycosidase family protein n=1 Tax=Erythrobacter sp. NE805 TaxID=3389875 RepID=UPI00396AF8F3
MRRLAILAGVLLALAACSESPEGQPVTRTALDGSVEASPEPAATATPEQALGPSACESVTFEDAALTHCIADPAQHRIGMANVGPDKQPFGSLAKFAATVDPATIAFAMNGGMYGDDLKALGYYVENGERMKELDRGEGAGNFYMKPNGVFFGSGGSWKVMGSNTFFNTVGDRPEFGTQSGPLLLDNGKMHPEVQDNGPSKAIRNAVGVGPDGRAHFVISDTPVSFGQLARYYRDVLKVQNALYLDGAVSSLWDPAGGRQDGGRVGPIIVVTRRGAASPPAAVQPASSPAD